MAPWPSVHTDFLLKAALRMGYEVHYLRIGGLQAGGLPPGVQLHSLEPRRPMGLRYTGQISLGLQTRRLLKRIKPDVLHIHTLFAGRHWRELPWLWPLYSYHPLVLTAWGGDLMVTPGTSRSARRLIQFALRSADMVLGNSEALLDVAHSLGVARQRLHEMQFGIDTELFSPAQDTTQVREALALGPGPVVYSPRAFTPTYNQLAIAEAIPKVLQVIPECRFLFQRRAEFHRPEYEAEVQERLDQQGVNRAVRILPPSQYEDMPSYYALADVLVSVPSHEGMPRSVLEAVACGAFPVVSDLPALREWITDGENGLILSSVEPKQIAEAILYALSHKSMTEKASQINREIVERRWSYSFWLQRLDELYKLAVAGKSYSHA
ncbi:MAG: glycosyltransferase family 4 protein [Dehalococcoidia bacterium]|nr:glycosyltransferase family 4 protein [Dehalococcoidia bacterium]